MNNEIVDYIKTQSKAGHSKALITSALKKAGYTDVEISSALSRIDDDTRSIPAPPPKKDTPAPAKSPSKPMDVTKVFVFLGSILILIAIIVIIFSQWESVNALTRVLFIALPMLILFAISGLTAKDKSNESVSNITLVTATIIFPVFIGTFLYQFEIIDEVNALLFAISSFSCFILCAIFEFVLQKRNFTFLSILSFWIAVFALEIHLNLNEELLLWSSLIIAILILLFGFYLLIKKRSYANLYIILATIGICYLFPSASIYSLREHASLSQQGAYVVLSIFTIFYLFVASIYNKLRFYYPDSPFYSLKRIIEEISPIVLIYPLILAGRSTSYYVYTEKQELNYLYTIAAIILSIIVVLISYKVKIKSMLWVGSLGLMAGILSITADLFNFESVGWPIVIFIAGFIFIGIGFLLRKLSLAQQNEHPPMILGIGEDPKLAGARSDMSALQKIILIVFAIGAANLLFESLMYQSYDYNQNYDQPSDYPYNYEETVSYEDGYINEIYYNTDKTKVTQISINKYNQYYGTFSLSDNVECYIDGYKSTPLALNVNDNVDLSLNSKQLVIKIYSYSVTK